MMVLQAPEMVRVPLEELVLQIKVLRLGGAAAFLSRVLQPPPERAVEGALRALRQVGALGEGEELTPLGERRRVGVCFCACLSLGLGLGGW